MGLATACANLIFSYRDLNIYKRNIQSIFIRYMIVLSIGRDKHHGQQWRAAGDEST